MSLTDGIEIHSEAVMRHAYSSDAGFYRLLPECVARPRNEGEVVRLIDWCRSEGRSLTFRGAGTSLAGQSVCNSVLVDLKRYWNHIEVRDNGKTVITQPGAVAGRVNMYLKQYGRHLGPDPASINACTVGGIAANNSSGMMSGIDMNAYHSIRSLRFILANGLTIDSSGSGSDDALRSQAPEIYDGLLAVRDKIRSSPSLTTKIREQYRVKNTIGYSLNAFLDWETPSAILARLMIGSEGTLGFISSIEWESCPDYDHKYTSLLFFPDIATACGSIAAVRELGATAVEFLDYNSLLSIGKREGVPPVVRALPQGTAALLIEFSEPGEAALEDRKAAFRQLVNSLRLTDSAGAGFIETKTAEDRAKLWKVRQGLLPSLSATRDKGSTVIIEDLAFRTEDLAAAVTDLQELFRAFGYGRTGIYGHGLDGNVHFIIAENFDRSERIADYDRFMHSLFDLVVGKYNGSLKAEHGTGRNMATFVEKQWGSEAWSLMKSIKTLLDPHSILNPGVVISDNDRIHLENIKSMPAIDDEVDGCIECGFCEPSCPSRDLTLTPRQRIVLRREVKRCESDFVTVQSITKDYGYYGMDTCAVDGLCAVNCPLEINTGNLVKELRHQGQTKLSDAIAGLIAGNFAAASLLIKAGIMTARAISSAVGERNLNRLTGTLFRGRLPRWDSNINLPAKSCSRYSAHAQFLYFPCCVSRLMGRPPGGTGSIIETMLSVSGKAGLSLNIPGDNGNYCCGMAFHSKGYFESYRVILGRTIRKMWEWTDGGRLPVILDSSSCTYSFRNCRSFLDSATEAMYNKLVILDSVEFIHDNIIPALPLRKLPEKAVLHPNCSLRKMNLDGKLLAIAEQCAETAVVPRELNCCGYAGDRGLLRPELTWSATKAEAAEVKEIGGDSHYSSNIPCEAGMSGATGKEYLHIIYLVERSAEAT